MKNELTNCRPTILGKTMLITHEGEFMGKPNIKERCKCVCKNTCLQIVDLLDNNKFNEALNLMSEIKKQYEITREGKDDMELEIKKTRELLDYFDIIIGDLSKNDKRSLDNQVKFYKNKLKELQKEYKNLLSLHNKNGI